MSFLSLPIPTGAGATAGVAQPEPEAKLIEPGSVSVYMLLDQFVEKGTDQPLLRPSTEPPPRRVKSAPFEQYCFNVIRTVSRSPDSPAEKLIEINSKPLKSICRRVMGEQFSWSSNPLRIPSIAFFPHYYRLKAYLETLRAETAQPLGAEHLDLLLTFLYIEHFSRFWELEDLISRGEITFELLDCILLPGTVLFTRCSVTGEPRACRLVEIQRKCTSWKITAAYVEAMGSRDSSMTDPPFGHAELVRHLETFPGVAPICSLDVYPMKMHENAQDIRRQLVARGRLWETLTGVLHKQYDGLAYGSGSVLICSRIMIDRDMYNADSPWNTPKVVKNHRRSPSKNARRGDKDGDVPPDPYKLLSELSDDDALMAPALVYGFSLEYKRWFRFNLKHISDIKWREDSFERLVLPEAQKKLIKRLVDVQATKRAEFGDLVEGKGRGLVLNLFGPAGVGKTLSAEAASEHLHRPLYVVGANDLATSPEELDEALTTIFKLGSAWGALVLIDEADVYLEQRTTDSLERNALVAVFLRQLEYFAGILFLTTNRVRAFDSAFQSRIHVSLYYRDLDDDARRTLWRGFVGDAGGSLSPDEEVALAAVPLNGRQIKNAVKTASVVASAGDEPLAFEHIKDVVEIMRQFEENLRAESRIS